MMHNRAIVLAAVVILGLNVFLPVCFSAMLPTIIPAPKGLSWKNYEIEIESGWKILITNRSEVSVVAEYLRSGLSNKSGTFLGIQRSPLSDFKKSIVLFLSSEKVLPDAMKSKGFLIPTGLDKEGYFLEVFNDCIFIVAESPAGLFYGAVTLLQMADTRGGKAVIQAAKITDFPSFRIRGVHILDPEPEKLKGMFDAMADIKMNFAIVSTWKLYDLDKEDNAQVFEEAFEYARSLFIEPIPELATFGQAGAIVTREPNAAEGIWVKDELYKFYDDKAEPVLGSKSNLANLIRSEESDVIITDTGKSTIYKEGIDYKIAGGKASYPFFSSNSPAEIIRLPSGNIKDMQEVLVTYDFIENKCEKWAPWCVPFCPSSKLAYDNVCKYLGNAILLLQPKYISISNDEIRGMNRDSRCLKRGMTNAELLADEINKVNDFVKSISPGVRLIMWDDMISPWHNGGDINYQVQFGGIPGKTSDAIGLIPRDMIIMVWWYDHDDWLTKMKNSPDYFESHGFDYLGAAYKDKENIKDWGVLIKKNPKCMGLITTTWDGWNKNIDGIRATAEEAW